MTFCLDSIIIRPESNAEIKNAIILLHGYGGDGKDISIIVIKLEETFTKYNLYLPKCS